MTDRNTKSAPYDVGYCKRPGYLSEFHIPCSAQKTPCSARNREFNILL
jgi:hypothetical protein